MFSYLFGIVILWVLVSLAVGVYTKVFQNRTQDVAVHAAVHTFRLPYDVVVKLFK